RVERGVQRFEGGAVERIQLVGAVDGDDADGAVVGGEDELGHGVLVVVAHGGNFALRTRSDAMVSVAVKPWGQYPTVSRRGGQAAPPRHRTPPRSVHTGESHE